MKPFPAAQFKCLICFSLLMLSGLLVLAAEKPALLRVSTVGTNGMPKDIVPVGFNWNFGSGSLWTHQGWQYAAYWDDACQVSVARRQLPEGAWSVISLPGYQRTTNINRGIGGAVARGFGDGHEKVSLGISPDGFIHLAFDHHVSTLHYRRSNLPVADDPAEHQWTADLFGPVQDNLGGERLERVTYPGFCVAGSGLLLYLRMGGGSGSANSHLLRYTEGRWTVNTEDASQFIDKKWSGGDGTVNAYPHSMVVRNGRRHLTWCWRDTPDETTCHDLCYAYSDDEGKTWRNNDGKLIGVTGTNFISADSPGVAVVKIPRGSRYRNGGSMTVDAAGRVHVLMRGEDASPVYFSRDPGTGKWSRKKSEVLGSLLAGPGDDLFVVTEEGVYRTSAARFGKVKLLVAGKPDWFRDCAMSVDRNRFEYDGCISAIGQQGKTVRVIDYWVAQPAAPEVKVLPPLKK